MAKKHKKKSSSPSDELGCLISFFGLLVSIICLLFLSGNPKAKKAAWGIIGVIALMCFLGSVKVSGIESLIIITIIIVIIIICYLAISTKTDQTTTGASNRQTDDSISDSRSKYEIKKRMFDEQLAKMEAQSAQIRRELENDDLNL